VSAITLVEVIYLVEKGKLPQASLDALVAALADPSEAMHLLPVESSVTQAVHQIPRAWVPDMPDRIIAATAWAHGLRLVTCDPDIRATSLPTIW
jgi:PIN domain nuclease of toxin-antitoxin system